MIKERLEFPKPKKPSVKARILGLAAIYAFFLALAFFFSYPHRPADAVGWLLFLGLAVPLLFIFEIVGEIAWRPVNKWFSRINSSAVRILIGVLLALVLIGIGMLAWYLVRDNPVLRNLGDFLSRHFEEW